jgi:hypothetical protein
MLTFRQLVLSGLWLGIKILIIAFFSNGGSSVFVYQNF